MYRNDDDYISLVLLARYAGTLGVRITSPQLLARRYALTYRRIVQGGWQSTTGSNTRSVRRITTEAQCTTTGFFRCKIAPCTFNIGVQDFQLQTATDAKQQYISVKQELRRARIYNCCITYNYRISVKYNIWRIRRLQKFLLRKCQSGGVCAVCSAVMCFLNNLIAYISAVRAEFKNTA